MQKKMFAFNLHESNRKWLNFRRYMDDMNYTEIINNTLEQASLQDQAYVDYLESGGEDA